MTITDSLARDDGAFDVNTGTESVPVWTPIGGVNNWSPSPSKNDADTTKFSDGGNQAHLPASRGMEYTLSGIKQVDPDTGARDPGQAALETLGLLNGPAGLGQFRHSMIGGDVAIFKASVNVTSGGGGNDDPNAWEATLTRSGASTFAAASDVPEAPTAVAGSTDDGQSEITWTTGAGEPTLFEVRIYDDGELVRSVITSQDGSLLVVDLDNGTAYTAAVRAQNNAGWSELSTASSPFTPAS